MLPDFAKNAREYIVAADHAAASTAGAEILAAGGNAVDAAVATSFALAVVRPESCGLGGGGFMVIHRPGLSPVALDFRETAPAGATLDRYRDANGRPIAGHTRHGEWAVGVPGQIKGLLVALEQYGSGRVSRAAVLAPAIRLAGTPLAVDPHLHNAMLEVVEDLEDHPEFADRFAALAARFLVDGAAVPVGDTVDVSEIAHTLKRIASDGLDAFDTGEIGQRIVEEIQRRGGPMTLDDLRDYSVRTLEPLRGRFAGFDILTMPPPSSGGAVLLQIMQTLDAARSTDASSAGLVGAFGHAHAHVLVEAAKHAFADRARCLGDRSPAVMADVARMISPARAADVSALIDPDRTRSTNAYGATASPRDDGGTSHYCVVDADGMAVAGTDTINLEFGSYILVPGLGVVLNNEMDDFAVDTTTPNAFGLRQSDRNLVHPGRRPLSSMSPTIVLRDGEAFMMAGASGGPRIISATTQVILNVIDQNMSVDRAIASPRWHHQWLPDELRITENAADGFIRAMLERGHTVRLTGGSIAHVQAVARTARGWRGACDPEKGGRPAGR